MKKTVSHESLYDLIGALHFIERASSRLYGLPDLESVAAALGKAFENSQGLVVAVMKLSGDGKQLRMIGHSFPKGKLAMIRQIAGIDMHAYTVSLAASTVLRSVIAGGETVQFPIGELMREVLPSPVFAFMSKLPGFNNRNTVATPILHGGRVVGLLSVRAHECVEHYIPAVENLSRHISAALELSDAHRETNAKAEQSRALSDQWQATFDAIDDMVSIQDTECHLVRVNRAYARVVDIKSEKLAGRLCHDVVHRSSCQPDTCPGRIALAERRAVTGEMHEPTLNAYLEISTSPIINSQGEVTGIVHVTKNVTERKRQEQALLAAKEDAEEANRQLEAAIERANTMAVKAEAASISKSQFLANMSHEIRTPLNGIIGFSSLLDNGDLSDQQREYVSLIRRSGEALLTVINDVLDYSKIEADKLVVEEIAFSVRDVVEESLDILAYKAQEKGLELVCDIPRSFPGEVLGDPHRLRQVVMNLVGNAVKFTDAGQVVVRARENERDNGRTVCSFEVADSGIGISEEDMPRLFEPFTQLDGSLARKQGGTGLGLVISQRLVKLMGGKIDVESVPGRGTAFTFSCVFGVPKGSVSPETPGSGRGRALVADRNAIVRTTLCQRMTEMGYVAAEAEDTSALLRALTRSHHDVAFVDVHLCSSEVVEYARTPHTGKDTRFVEMRPVTGLATGDGNGALPGAVRITKPFKQADLDGCLDKNVTTGRTVADKGVSVRSFGGVRVLVAEDNEVNQMVVEKMLARLGCRTRIVSDGEEAIEELSRNDYDIMLLDLQMPGIDGFETVERIRLAETPGRHTPIVAVTAHAGEDDRRRCLAAGMDGFLRKPLSMESLETEIGRQVYGLAPVHRSGNVVSEERVPVGQQAGPSLDASSLMDRLAGDGELHERILRTYLENVPVQLAGLRRHAEAGDGAQLRMQAHALKGASATVGAERMRSLAERVEKAAGDRRGDTWEALVHALEEEFRTVQMAAARILGAGAPV